VRAWSKQALTLLKELAGEYTLTLFRFYGDRLPRSYSYEKRRCKSGTDPMMADQSHGLADAHRSSNRPTCELCAIFYVQRRHHTNRPSETALDH